MLTVKELSQLFHLNREIEQQKKRLLYLTQNRKNWHEHDCILNGRNGTPRVEMVFSLPDSHMDNPFHEEIEKLREAIKRNLSKCLREQQRLELYIGNIEDSEMRQIFSLRYVNGLPWAQIAACISPYSTENSVKVAHHRFLKTCNQCNETA